MKYVTLFDNEDNIVCLMFPEYSTELTHKRVAQGVVSELRHAPRQGREWKARIRSAGFFDVTPLDAGGAMITVRPHQSETLNKGPLVGDEQLITKLLDL